MRKSHKVDVSLDSEIDLESLVVTVATYAVSSYVLTKGFKTLCSVVEHIVVTKIS